MNVRPFLAKMVERVSIDQVHFSVCALLDSKERPVTKLLKSALQGKNCVPFHFLKLF